MSKAFVRESDEEEDRPEEPHALPVGCFKNYMTPGSERGFRSGEPSTPPARVTQAVLARAARTRARLVDVVHQVDLFPAAP
jgi:hypothetical protein